MGTPGLLYVKKFKGMMMYYEKDDQKTKDAFYNDYATVGDIAYLSVERMILLFLLLFFHCQLLAVKE